MRAIIYPAIIERSPDGFGVFFPDLPGCRSAGRSRADAAMNACQALSQRLTVMLADGVTLPAPSEHGHLTIEPDIKMVDLIMVRAELD